MGRRHPTKQPPTALGAALLARRAGRKQRDVAQEIGTSDVTLGALELGTRKPSADTARALARWLGWTTDQVLDAAEQPATPSEPAA